MNTDTLNLILSIGIAAFFSFLVIWTQLSVFKKQKEFEIKRNDYKETTERLANIGKRCSGVWSVRETRKLGLHPESLKAQIERYEQDKEIRMKAHSDNIQFFPERHILDISINNSFRQRLDVLEYPDTSQHKSKDKVDELEKSGHTGLSIIRELIKIRWKIATDILNDTIKNKDQNKIYLERVYRLLKHNKGWETYEDTHTKKKRFEEFKSIIADGQE